MMGKIIGVAPGGLDAIPPVGRTDHDRIRRNHQCHAGRKVRSGEDRNDDESTAGHAAESANERGHVGQTHEAGTKLRR